MKIIMTGSDRAYCLAALLPPSIWEQQGITVSNGPLRGGHETFIFDCPDMCQTDAIEFVEKVLEMVPPSPKNTWFPVTESPPPAGRFDAMSDEEKEHYLEASEIEDDIWRSVVASF